MRPPPTKLERRIAGLIEATGPIGVPMFMGQALYDPTDGYYTTHSPLGAGGDFTTAPEISQMFGELIGLWLAQSWLDMGTPPQLNLIELGPGRGTLMADALRAAGKVPGFVAAIQLHMVELNPILRSEQAKALAAYQPRWHNDLSTVPHGPMLLIGNEFLDCLPVRQFVRGQNAWHEKLVGIDEDGRLAFGLGPELPDAPGCTHEADPVGSVREETPGLALLLDALANLMTPHPARALFIDYGDISGQPGDTLQALYRHTKVNPLDHVGQADLTAHVDFAALSALAQTYGLQVDGPVPQGDFLRALGIEARRDGLAAANPAKAASMLEAVERLVSSAHMGTLFQAVCLTSPPLKLASRPVGF